MPKERTPESGVPLKEKVKRALPSWAGGRKGDVRLPAQNAGERDPRLPPPTAIDNMRESMDVIRGLGKQSRRSEGRGKRATARRA